ncbi:MAG: hypothetical protein Q8859_01870 [Bacteroidota bacterium]|nr:hypothetical protein [Bacteroidota bacterium]
MLLISEAEFIRLFQIESKEKADRSSKQKGMNFPEHFIDYKLKMEKAEQLRLDTTQRFKNEFLSYREVTAKTYLSDSTYFNQIVLHTYQNIKNETKASHILIKVNEDALPVDTLKAYNKIMSLRKQIIDGKDFGRLDKNQILFLEKPEQLSMERTFRR